LNYPAIHLDALIARGAAATQRRFPTKQMAYGRKAGVQKSTAQRHFAGDKHSPATHYLRGAMLIGWPLIAESIVALNHEEIRRATNAELIAEYNRLVEREHELEARENRENWRAAANPTAEQLEAAAEASVAEGEVQLQLAAVQREMAERKRRGVL
jgi:hypothetical protein